MTTNIRKYLILFVLALCWLCQSCKVTRHLKPNEFLLKATPTLKTGQGLSESQLSPAVKTRANGRMILPKTSLHIHNLGVSLQKKDSASEFISWLKYGMGEPPILIDTSSIFRDVSNLKNSCFANGYFYPKVSYKIDTLRYLNKSDTVKWISEGKIITWLGRITGIERAGNKDTLIWLAENDSLKWLKKGEKLIWPHKKDTLEIYQKDIAPEKLDKNDKIIRVGQQKYKQKARVSYEVDPGVSYKIREVRLTALKESEDNEWLLNAYRMELSLLKSGGNYQHSLMTQERVRATNLLRNSGYFTFSQKMISFSIDTINSSDPNPQTQRVSESVKYLDIEIQLKESPPRYVVRNIEVTITQKNISSDKRREPLIRLRADELTPSFRDQWKLPTRKLDTMVKISFLVDSSLVPKLNYNFLAKRVHLIEKKVYRQNLARKTQQRLQELGMFQFAIINYDVQTERPVMDVLINIQLSSKYQLKAGFETFSNDIRTSNIPSLGANISIRNKNTFGKSELLELGANGNIGFYSSQEGAGQFDQFYYEAGVSANLHFPRFLLPFPIRKDLSRFSPNTTISTNYQQENRREYNRFTTGAKLQYRWNHIPFQDRAISQLTPIAVDFISIDILDSTFQQTVDSLPSIIRRDYENRFSSRLQYHYTHQNYQSTRAHPTYWYRISIEWGGNLPFLLDNINGFSKSDTSGGDNLLFNRLFYGQYVKGSLEGKLYVPINSGSELVFRGIIGASTPYNETPLVPQESRFFAGGTNGMRGWQSNTLGPGRSKLEDFQGEKTNIVSSLIAPGGEYLLQINAEYRFDVFSYLEMAVFSDLGNVWFNGQAADSLGTASVLNKDNFRLGWDVGLGVRLDFSFLILRMDIGRQLYAPDVEKGWVIKKEDAGTTKRIQYNLGIGYPF